MKLVTSVTEDSKFWLKQWRIWRIQLELKVYKHVHHEYPDRWVIQTSVVYDRKTKTPNRKVGAK